MSLGSALRRFGFVGGILVIALTALLVLTTCGRPLPRPTPPPSASPSNPLAFPPIEAIATSAGPFASGPVKAPRDGAYLGAWVRPAQLTQPQRVEAVTELEDQLGRRLNIVNTYRRFDQPLLTSSDLTFTERGSTMMLSWAGGDTRAITMGKYDKEITAGAQAVKKYGKPILIRFRWEMDRPGLAASMWSPADYVAAWKYVRAAFDREGARNASWVWCPTNDGFVGGYAGPFYPGDDQVDWICVDVYAGNRYAPMGTLLKPFLQWSAKHPTKPLMIGEFGVARAYGDTTRAAWVRNAGEVFKANPQIRAALYFDSNPDDAADTPTQQFEISNDPPVLAAFTAVAREPYFNPRR